MDVRYDRGTLTGAAVVLALLTAAPSALADDAKSAPPAPPAPPMPGIVVQVPVALPADPNERLASMESLMFRLEQPAKQYRLIGGLTAIGLGAVTIPVSAAMLSRGSSTEMGPVILLGLGMGEVIGGGFVLATPGPYASGYAPVTERIAAGRKAGEPAEKTLADAERIWHERAIAAYEGRRALGGIALAIGVVATGFGVALDAANPIGGLARSDQDGLSVAAFGIGYAAILSGVRSFVFPTPVELSWQVYRGGDEPPKPSAAHVALQGFQPISVPGGAGAGWGVGF